MPPIPIIAALALTFVSACAPKATKTAQAAPPAVSDDLCGAGAYQGLIGQNKSAIPATPAGKAGRVACTTCPVTMDFRADRLNIFYNEKTGLIEQVKCG